MRSVLTRTHTHAEESVSCCFMYVMLHTQRTMANIERPYLSKGRLSTHSSLLPFKVNSVVALKRSNVCLVPKSEIFFLAIRECNQSRTVCTRSLPNILCVRYFSSHNKCLLFTCYYISLFMPFSVIFGACMTIFNYTQNIYPRTTIDWTCAWPTDDNFLWRVPVPVMARYKQNNNIIFNTKWSLWLMIVLCVVKYFVKMICGRVMKFARDSDTFLVKKLTSTKKTTLLQFLRKPCMHLYFRCSVLPLIGEPMGGYGVPFGVPGPPPDGSWPDSVDADV